MHQQKPRRNLPDALAAAAHGYQVAKVIPHCADCARPCCRLDPLVLELTWQQLKTLWQLEESRTAFDRRLSAGKGPKEIRAMRGLYFAHRKICPAYDTEQRTCRVYNHKLKPIGCTDFPVYQDQDSIIADLRCEAVDLEALIAWITHSLAQGFRIVQSADQEFPFMVTLSLRKL